MLRRLFPEGAFLPQRVGKVESLFLRLGLVAITIWSCWKRSPYDSMERPAGLGQWIDFSFLGKPGVHPWFLALLALAGSIYLLGTWRGTRWTLVGVLPLTLGHVAYWTLRNSQGNTFHGSNLTSLVLLGQLIACVIQLWRESKATRDSPRWPGLDGMLLYFSQSAIAACYVASGLTKLARTQGRWVLDSHLFAKSVQKVWRQHYFDDPTNQAYSGISPWAQWLVEHPMLARFMFGPGFFLELFAFLLLASRRWALALGLSIIAMHFFIEQIMVLEFREWQALSLVFAVNLPFWICARQKSTAS
jgi:hypothetical protein